MENNVIDINDLVLQLAVTGMKPLLNDDVWQCYGFKRTPRHGNIWNRIFPKKFELEDFITREILTMGLIDILNGIKKTEETKDTKLLLSIGVIDKFLSMSEQWFTLESLMEKLFSTYASYMKSEKSKLYEPIILKAKDILSKKDFVKFMVGTIKLLVFVKNGDFLLTSDYIKSIIENTPWVNKLKINVSKEMFGKYILLFEKNILNI